MDLLIHIELCILEVDVGATIRRENEAVTRDTTSASSDAVTIVPYDYTVPFGIL